MASYWCSHCDHRFTDADLTETAVRKRLSRWFDQHPDDVAEEDVALALDECPGCGFMSWVVVMAA